MANPLSPLSDSEGNSRSSSRETYGNMNHPGEDTENFAIHEDPIPDPTFLTATDLFKSPAPKSSTPSSHETPIKPPSETPKRTPLGELSPREQQERSSIMDDDNVFEDAEPIDPPPGGRSSPTAVSCKDFNADDTCLSTFSMVAHDMTHALRQQHSPTKSSGLREELMTPRSARPTTPSTARLSRTPHSEVSPTPRRAPAATTDDATTQLLEFTEPLNIAHAAPRSALRGDHYSPSKSRGSPTKPGRHPATPRESRHLANLLDFDMPPAPTPRSIPTITARELESLKAGLLSEISSLRAHLSGQEAQIRSLVTAKDDAEQRHGRAQEELRESRDTVTGLQEEKAGWEKRDKELKDILRGAKDELVHRDKEREELAGQLEVRTTSLEAAEARVAEAESTIAGLKTAAAATAAANDDDAVTLVDGAPGTHHPSTPGNEARAVEAAVEQVSRDLHALYKTKHETKVTALKKSYEARWERRVRELQERVAALTRENDELRLGRDATMSGVVPGSLVPGSLAAAGEADQRDANAQLRAEETRAAHERVEELEARVTQLEVDLGAGQRDQDGLRAELDTSRRANGELVAAVEQMLQLEGGGGGSGGAQDAAPVPALPPSAAAAGMEAPAPARPASRSGGRPKLSGLRGPGFGAPASESRIGTVRSASGTVRSGIMGNIERMGRGRTAGD